MSVIAPQEPVIALPVRFERSDLATHAGLSDDSLVMLRGSRGPEGFIADLQKAGSTADLVITLAFLLPKRQAVWWACLVARLVPGAESSPNDQAALTLAETWVQTGDDEARERAEKAAEACNHEGPAAWAAMGAFWSGGSIAPRGQGTVSPAAHLTAVATRSALFLATLAPGMRANLNDLSLIGLDLIAGGSGREVCDAIRMRSVSNSTSGEA